MALYHLSMKSGSKGNGASGTAKALYVCREGKYADKQDFEYKESGNMPTWAQRNPRTFWKASDQNERANGRVWTEIEISLPRESIEEERKKLVQGFIADQLKDHPYTVAIHNPKALDGDEQPHAHIIFSERKLDGIDRDKEQFFKRANAKEPAKGGTAKDRAWNERDKVQAVREAWERHYNKAVCFQELQVSCKSLKAQGIDRDPEPKLGPKGLHSPAADRVKEARADRQELIEIDREMRKLSREIEAAKEPIKPTPQDIVIEAQPPKANHIPASEPKAEKIQEVVQTPDMTRRGDPDQLQEKPVNTTSSESLEASPLGNKSFIQQPVFKSELQSVTPSLVVEPVPPAFTTAELAYHAALRRIAAISKNFVSLYKSLTDGTLFGGEEKYNDLTDRLEEELKKLVAPYQGTKVTVPHDDTPITVNGQPITEIVKGLPPDQPQPEPPKLTPQQGRKR